MREVRAAPARDGDVLSAKRIIPPATAATDNDSVIGISCASHVGNIERRPARRAAIRLSVRPADDRVVRVTPNPRRMCGALARQRIHAQVRHRAHDRSAEDRAEFVESSLRPGIIARAGIGEDRLLRGGQCRECGKQGENGRWHSSAG